MKKVKKNHVLKSGTLLCRYLNKCSLFTTLREPSVKLKDLQTLTLVGPTRDNSVLDPLAVLHLNYRLSLLRNLIKQTENN